MGLGRAHLAYRSFSIVGDGAVETLTFSPFEKVGTGKVAFAFTGQGAQWEGMARSLIHASPSFRRDIREMDAALRSLSEWTIEDLLSSGIDGEQDYINKTEFAQPLCTAVQIAVVNFLARCGITPCAVVGHSSGEIAAAYAAGALTASEAIVFAFARGQATRLKGRTGLMAAVGLGRNAVLPHLAEGAIIACENSAQSVTVSGDPEAVRQTLETIKAEVPDTFARLLHVNVAYHSHHMRDVGAKYEELLAPYAKEGRETGMPAVPFFSSVYGKALPAETRLDRTYWRKNLESPVLFLAAASSLLTGVPDVATVLEIGPHSALRGPLRQIFQERNPKRGPSYVPTLVRNNDCISSILDTVGQLYVRGHAVDFSFLNSATSMLVDLPNYPWDHSEEYWKESRVSEAWRMKGHRHHEVLGDKCAVASSLEPVWRNVFHHSDVPWLADHKVETNVVFPCAGYVAVMGEAVRQALCSNGYELRNLTVKAALVLPETEVVEMMTTMRPARLTDLTNSPSWHDICISTFNGTAWTENCTAQGRAAGGDGGWPGETGPRLTGPYSRQIPKSYFYDRVRHLGLRLGPRFQGMTDISADTERQAAAAAFRDDAAEYEAPYAAHPTTIDCCLQLCIVSSCRGVARNMDTLALPIGIRRVVVIPGKEPDLVASAETDPASATASAVALAKDSRRPIIVLENARCIPFDTGDDSDGRDSLTSARLEWLPDIDCLPSTDDLIWRGDGRRKQHLASERLTSLGILQTLHVLKSLEVSPSGHLAKYVAWLEEEKQAMVSGDRPLALPEEREWASMEPSALKLLASSALEELEALGDGTVTSVGRMLYDMAQQEAIEPIFGRGANPEQPIVAGGRINDLYTSLQTPANAAEFFRLCGHAKPTMKVLEIGAGTGSTTEQILNSLVSDDDIRLYGQYIFTDISSSFFTDASKRFEDRGGMAYKALDITKSPAEQGFELGSFDLVVAANVLHATPSLQESLQNVRSLLRPDGRLYLVELAKPLAWRTVGFVAGRLPGWWLGEEDGRADVPFVSVDRWDAELRAAGFSGAESSVLDDEAPYSTSAHITSRVAAALPQPEAVTILYREARHELACSLADALAADGVAVHWARLGSGEGLDNVQHVIAAVDLERPFFDDIAEPDYQAFMALLAGLKGGILWLTGSAQIACTDPRYGLVNGVARTARVELSVDFWTAELQRPDASALKAIMAIARKFFGRAPLSRGTDTEFAVHDGMVRTARCHWTSLTGALEPEADDGGARQMVIGQYGAIDSLHWVRSDPGSLQAHEVEVDIRCVGLNFRDNMVAMGLLPMPKDKLGFEAGAVVCRVGSAVDHVAVGDRVCVLNTGLFATRKVVAGHCVFRIPDNLTLADAATVPVVYGTAIAVLIYQGQLQRGQSVLIHSAAGGVGQAAINICQMLGAEIFATVGSEKKAGFLVENYGIVRERIFNSRSASFLDDVMRATQDRGVDIVLNALSGDLLHASWKCVAKGGKMMEIGKRDILERGRLDLDGFQDNRSFHSFDLHYLLKEQPDVCTDILRRSWEWASEGHIKPIQPIHEYPVQNLPDAVRFMRTGEHIGKIVATIPGNPASIPATNVAGPGLLSDTSTYLLVGGLGGLGKAVTRWLVERGARSLCFLSRSAGASEQDQVFFRELESQGCRVATVAGSVADMADVRKAVEAAPTLIGGVLQLSMVLRDRAFLQMSYDDWRAAQEPKVRGTWNLHTALAETKLDFFILLSSISGTVGQPGQANYASANSFLDSFVQYRHGLGLPCSVIDLGAMEGIGYLSDKRARLDQYKSFGAHVLQERHLVDAIQLAMKRSVPTNDTDPASPRGPLTNMSQLIVGLTSTKAPSDPTNRTAFRHDVRVGIYNNMVTGSEATALSKDQGMSRLVSQFEANPGLLADPDAVSQVSLELGRLLFRLLLLPEETLDTSMSLASIGIDSLASIEIRNWWRKTLGDDKSVLDIMSAGTIEGLGRLAVVSLQKKHGVGVEA
ncbi:hypothetical protein CDD83_9169 [Cordyceps sp. RAO-2017]|nr:hypothetical protein CDD83_9169 [Cordyceps sp. RAO-2017]